MFPAPGESERLRVRVDEFVDSMTLPDEEVVRVFGERGLAAMNTVRAQPKKADMRPVARMLIEQHYAGGHGKDIFACLVFAGDDARMRIQYGERGVADARRLRAALVSW